MTCTSLAGDGIWDVQHYVTEEKYLTELKTPSFGKIAGETSVLPVPTKTNCPNKHQFFCWREIPVKIFRRCFERSKFDYSRWQRTKGIWKHLWHIFLPGAKTFEVTPLVSLPKKEGLTSTTGLKTNDEESLSSRRLLSLLLSGRSKTNLEVLALPFGTKGTFPVVGEGCTCIKYSKRHKLASDPISLFFFLVSCLPELQDSAWK